MPDTCTGPHPEGPRDAEVGGLCGAHYRQRQRDPRAQLRPLRRRGPEPLVHLWPRVSAPCARALEATGAESASAAAVLVLEAWAMRRRRP